MGQALVGLEVAQWLWYKGVGLAGCKHRALATGSQSLGTSVVHRPLAVLRILYGMRRLSPTHGLTAFDVRFSRRPMA